MLFYVKSFTFNQVQLTQIRNETRTVHFSDKTNPNAKFEVYVKSLLLLHKCEQPLIIIGL